MLRAVVCVVLVGTSGCGLVLEEPADSAAGLAADASVKRDADLDADSASMVADAETPDRSIDDASMPDASTSDASPDDASTPDDGVVPSIVDDCTGGYGVDDDSDGLIDEDCTDCTQVSPTGWDEGALADPTHSIPFRSIQVAIDTAASDPSYPPLVCVGTPACMPYLFYDSLQMRSGIHVDGGRDSGDGYRRCPGTNDTVYIQPYESDVLVTVKFDAAPGASLSNVRLGLAPLTQAQVVRIEHEADGVRLDDVTIVTSTLVPMTAVQLIGATGSIRLHGLAIDVTSDSNARGVDGQSSAYGLDASSIAVTSPTEAIGVRCMDAACQITDTRVVVDGTVAVGIDLEGSPARVERDTVEFGCSPGQRTGVRSVDSPGMVQNSVIRMFDACSTGNVRAVGLFLDDEDGGFAQHWNNTVDVRYAGEMPERCEAYAIELAGDPAGSWWHNSLYAVGGCGRTAVILAEAGTSLPLDFHYNHYEMDPVAPVAFIGTEPRYQSNLAADRVGEYMWTETSIGLDCLEPGSLHVRPMSPCIDAGELIDLAGPTDDHDGRPRTGDRPDIGAFEDY